MFLKWEGLSAPGRWLKLFLEAFPESIPRRRQPVVGETFKHNLCQKCKCFRYNRRQASFWTTGIIPISSKNPLTKEELLRILQPILFWSNFVSVALWKTMCSLCAVAHCYITMYIYKKKSIWNEFLESCGNTPATETGYWSARSWNVQSFQWTFQTRLNFWISLYFRTTGSAKCFHNSWYKSIFIFRAKHWIKFCFVTVRAACKD